jgi:hypothetical protein
MSEPRWILNHIESKIGVGNWFTYFDLKETLTEIYGEFSELQFKKWMSTAAHLAANKGLCLAHPTEASDFQAVLVAAGDADKVTDAYLHVARTNVGVASRLEIYVDFLDSNASPGSDGALAAEAAKGLFQMQQILSNTLDNMNRQILEKRRTERRTAKAALESEKQEQ